MLRVMFIVVVVAFIEALGGRLTINNGHFSMDGERVFLTGMDQSYRNYAPLFASRDYVTKSKGDLQHYFTQLHSIEANALRIRVQFDIPNQLNQTTVSDMESFERLISNLKTYLRAAAENDVLVFITLWDVARETNSLDSFIHLMNDSTALQVYIDSILTPLVDVIIDEPAVAGWHIMNEPEGVLKPYLGAATDCENTAALIGSGVGWHGELFTGRQIQRFISVHAAAIHKADTEALVSVGAWNLVDNTDAFGLHDLYKDECLIAAGNDTKGVLDFYQFHLHNVTERLQQYLPFNHTYDDYESQGKPIFLELNPDGVRTVLDNPTSLKDAFIKSYNEGFTGLWVNTIFDASTVYYIKDLNDQTKGGTVKINV